MYGFKAPLSDTNGSSSATAPAPLKGFHPVLERFKAGGKPALGCWQMLPGHHIARMIAAQGFDWILIDGEHGNISDDTMHAQVAAIASQGVSPIVRVPAPEPWLIKRALDTGAHGIMVPMIETPEQAKAIVAAAKFPSTDKNPNSFNGFRGAGSPFAPIVYGQNLVAYTESANENTIIMVQIETRLGVKNARAIAEVPGIDMLFIGPNDLSLSLGFAPSNPHQENPKIQEVINGIKADALAAGKLVGIFGVNGTEVKQRFDQGFACANMGGDAIALMGWIGQEMAKVHGN